MEIARARVRSMLGRRSVCTCSAGTATMTGPSPLLAPTTTTSASPPSSTKGAVPSRLPRLVPPRHVRGSRSGWTLPLRPASAHAPRPRRPRCPAATAPARRCSAPPPAPNRQYGARQERPGRRVVAETVKHRRRGPKPGSGAPELFGHEERLPASSPIARLPQAEIPATFASARARNGTPYSLQYLARNSPFRDAMSTLAGHSVLQARHSKHRSSAS